MLVRSLGATPIDYPSGRVGRLMREFEPDGVDYVFDAVGGANIGRCIGALRRGGMVIGFGFHGRTWHCFQDRNVREPLHRRATSWQARRFLRNQRLYKKDPKPLREDLPKIFSLLAEKKIDPLVTHSFALLDGEEAIELLAGGRLKARSF